MPETASDNAPAVGDVAELIERLLACPGIDDPECNCAEAADRIAVLQQRVEELEQMVATLLKAARSNADAAEARERVLREALETILANTEKSAIKHMGHDGMTPYEALAKAVHDCASAALQEPNP